MRCVLMHKEEFKQVTGCFTSSKPIPPQKPCTVQTWKTKGRRKGPGVAGLQSAVQGTVH